MRPALLSLPSKALPSLWARMQAESLRQAYDYWQNQQSFLGKRSIFQKKNVVQWLPKDDLRSWLSLLRSLAQPMRQAYAYWQEPACLPACLPASSLRAPCLPAPAACLPACLPALPCLALPCLALPCLALPCLALPCLALPCLALPCLACLACLACLPACLFFLDSSARETSV